MRLGEADVAAPVQDHGQFVVGVRGARVAAQEIFHRARCRRIAPFEAGQKPLEDLLLLRGERYRRRGERGVPRAVLLLHLQVFQGGEVPLSGDRVRRKPVEPQKLRDVDEVMA